jgi:oxygen-independent coproporphyrinogen-3 oxidase
MNEIDLASLRALLPRYARALPRYTSYPTAPTWSEDFGVPQFRQALARLEGDASLYVHVPFCRSLCHFCACNRIVTNDPALPERYLDTLEREIARSREALPDGLAAAQLHLGGGTPTCRPNS